MNTTSIIHPALSRAGKLAAVLAAVCVLTAILPNVAGAAGVHLHGGTLQVKGAPGERNAVTLSQRRGKFTVTDRGARITPGRGCRSLPGTHRHQVTCPRAGVRLVRVNLGDRNDSFDAETSVRVRLLVLGGKGDDVLRGGGGADTLRGGPGNDILDGRGASDLLAGGSGSDTVDYSSRTAPVRVSLDGRAGSGAAGESDTVAADVEDIAGGAGADTLIGNDIPNRISGAAGNDSIDGRGGNDVLTADDGNDTVTGGRGDDEVLLGAGDDAATWNADDGNDSVDGAAGADVLRFTGSDASENLDLSSNGTRLRLTRDLGAAAIDGDAIEAVAMRALAGADLLHIGSLVSTAVRDVRIDLAGRADVAGDAAPDTVSVDATDRDDNIDITGDPGSDRTVVAGLPTAVSVAHADKDHDALRINGQAGHDHISAQGGLAELGVRLTLDGGAGDDTIIGGDGNDQLIGGDGNDTITGAAGDDVALLGTGDDNFAWNPGDGNDTVEGQAGTDNLRFDGSNLPDQFDLSSNGGRLRLTDAGATGTMDANGLEAVSLRALGGVDGVTVHDLSGTDVHSIRVDLSGGDGKASDGLSDSIELTGTARADAISALSASGETLVEGLATKVAIAGADAPGVGAGDLLRIDALDGNDSITADPTFMSLAVLGGGGTDTVTGLGTEAANVFNISTSSSGVLIRRDGHQISAQAENIAAKALGGNDVITADTGFATLGVSLTLEGGSGADTITGSDAGDRIDGGDGNDIINAGTGNDRVDGGRGNDSAALGGDNDTFDWNPGDGSDTVEGQAGLDTLQFNGANLAESFELFANGSRVRLTRDVGTIAMDIGGTENVQFEALGGADHVHFGDLAGTGVTLVSVDLGSGVASGDGQADAVSVDGTPANDAIDIHGSAGTGEVVLGLPSTVSVTHADGSLDGLIVNGLAGKDTINAAGLGPGAIKLTEDGGAGSDGLTGSAGADTILGGEDSDVIFPGRGDDVAFMGAGDDAAIWNPGDGSDIIEGQAGIDTVQFNGANIAEHLDLSANGPRLRLTRDVGSIVMDVAGTEKVALRALGGADQVAVHSLAGTAVTSVLIDLGSGTGTGDGAADSVTVDGTGGADALVVAGDASGLEVAGLPASVAIARSEGDRDALTVDALAGDDVIQASSLVAGAVALTEAGGDNSDVLIGSAGDDTLHGGPGDDTLIGGPGDDTLDGGPGNNVLIQ